jgi:hypothetical protein
MELYVGCDDFSLVPSVGVSTWGLRMSSGPALLVGVKERYAGLLVCQCGRHRFRSVWLAVCGCEVGDMCL